MSFLSFLISAAYLVIFGLLWRTLSARWAENSVGKAMAFIY